MAPPNLEKEDSALGSKSTNPIAPPVRARELQALGNLCSINPESRSIPLPASYLNSMTSQPTIRQGPPPLPPRQPGTFPTGYGGGYNRGYGGMGGLYSPYSRLSSYGLGGYSSPYGGMGYNRYGGASMGALGGPGDNSFLQMAEESTRPAFESIESVVEVFSSISMMLESTYHAVRSSYSAILGVVDQFSRLKDHLAQILSVLTLLRGLRWLCFKVLYLLGLRKDNPSVDAAWNSAERLGSGEAVPNTSGKAEASAWPFLMFVGLVIGAPWLMFKLLSKNVTKKAKDVNLYLDANGKQCATTATFDFNATRPGELSFRAGEKLLLTKQAAPTKGWIYVCNLKKQTGLVPYNYLAFKRNGNKAVLSYEVYPAEVPEASVIPESIPVQETEPSANCPSEISIPVQGTEPSVDCPPEISIPPKEKECTPEGERA